MKQFNNLGSSFPLTGFRRTPFLADQLIKILTFRRAGELSLYLIRSHDITRVKHNLKSPIC